MWTTTSVFFKIYLLLLCVCVFRPPCPHGTYMCRLQFLIIPSDLMLFSMHAVVPILHCIVNSISQPDLFHATMCVLREVHAHVCCCSSLFLSLIFNLSSSLWFTFSILVYFSLCPFSNLHSSLSLVCPSIFLLISFFLSPPSPFNIFFLLKL